MVNLLRLVAFLCVIAGILSVAPNWDAVRGFETDAFITSTGKLIDCLDKQLDGNFSWQFNCNEVSNTNKKLSTQSDTANDYLPSLYLLLSGLISGLIFGAFASILANVQKLARSSR